MNVIFRSYLKFLVLSVVIWTIAMTSFMIFRYFGLKEEGFIINSNSNFSFPTYLTFAFYLGILFGILYSIVYFLLDNYLCKNLPSGLLIIVEFVIFVCLLLLSINFIGLTFFSDLKPSNNTNYYNWWINNNFFWVTVYYAGFISLMISALQIGIERLGINVFYKIFIGKYRKPKEEKRIFMFLDLKSSTSIAEQLGHFKYSQFIQDCFLELNEVILKHSAEIYQYVGDEAVLVWNYKNGIKNNNAIAIYFSFLKRLESKESYFKKKYNVIPEFKAGVHGGKLMVAEVGSLKKEIAYHGDVINTASRIQSKCNEYHQKIMISEVLLKDMNITSDFTANRLGILHLKGKETGISLLGIQKLTKLLWTGNLNKVSST